MKTFNLSANFTRLSISFFFSFISLRYIWNRFPTQFTTFKSVREAVLKVVKFKIIEICSNKDRPEHFVLHPSISADMLTDGKKNFFSTLNDVDLYDAEFLEQEAYATQLFVLNIDYMLRVGEYPLSMDTPLTQGSEDPFATMHNHCCMKLKFAQR